MVSHCDLWHDHSYAVILFQISVPFSGCCFPWGMGNMVWGAIFSVQNGGARFTGDTKYPRDSVGNTWHRMSQGIWYPRTFTGASSPESVTTCACARHPWHVVRHLLGASRVFTHDLQSRTSTSRRIHNLRAQLANCWKYSSHGFCCCRRDSWSTPRDSER